jgi:hypothetical protein
LEGDGEMNSKHFIEQAIDYAEECIRDADSAFETMALELAFSQDDQFLQIETKERVTWTLTSAWRTIISLLQERGQSFLAESALHEYENFKSSPMEAKTDPDGEPYLVSSAHAWRWAELLRRLYVKTKLPPLSAAVQDIEQIIRRAETHLCDLSVFGWRPTEEDDVHHRLEGVLGCIFPDIKHTPTIDKPIKSFKPDTGIPSRRALIEYKYITDKAAGKCILDQILADISGYTSDRYDHFIFVIYETQRVFPEEQWVSHLTSDGIGERVQVILIKGVPPTDEDLKLAKKARERRNRKKDSVKKLAAPEQGAEAPSELADAQPEPRVRAEERREPHVEGCWVTPPPVTMRASALHPSGGPRTH